MNSYHKLVGDLTKEVANEKNLVSVDFGSFNSIDLKYEGVSVLEASIETNKMLNALNVDSVSFIKAFFIGKTGQVQVNVEIDTEGDIFKRYNR